MPLKLVPPRIGKTPFYSVRGTHYGIYVDRSTKATGRAQAAKLLKLWKDEIESGAVSKPREPTFLDASVLYMADTGNERFVDRVVDKLGKMTLPQITQQVVNETAIALYPGVTAATRNRQVHTVVSAILKHAGVEWQMKRPKGWRGSKRTDWLTPEQAFRVFRAAWDIDIEFGIFLITLCYTGMRLSEGTVRLRCAKVSLTESFAYIGKTKNDDPRGVHLPPVVVAALAEHPRGLDRGSKAVFRFRKNGRLYTLMKRVKAIAGPDVSFLTFHILRHTYGTWMRRYGGVDTTGLVATGAWKDPASARRYEHTTASEEAQRANLLPVAGQTKRIANDG